VAGVIIGSSDAGRRGDISPLIPCCAANHTEAELMSARTHLLAAALLSSVLFAAGCGDAAPDTSGEVPAAPAIEGVHGTAPPAVGGTPSVVVLRPSSPPPRPVRDAPHIDQLGLAFTPTLLTAMVGEPVVFTNSETITHNVHLQFTDTDSTVLNVETDPGAQAEFVFDREGGYDVLCDHHPGMRAFIYVSSSPYIVFADQSGNFQMDGVPPGSYTASLWSVDAELRTEQPVEVSGPSTEVSFGGS
jgi:plastocyanin